MSAEAGQVGVVVVDLRGEKLNEMLCRAFGVGANSGAVNKPDAG
jgi:hypothetical protein